jgi:DNA-binding GntR family transcriptional regulator
MLYASHLVSSTLDERGASAPPARQLERIQHSSLRDLVVEAIRDAIIQGKLKPGDKIPEAELAEQLGVSRTPIREAIRILEQQGLVKARPKNGTYIARLDPEELRDSLLVRASLEELAVRQALAQATEEEWSALCDGLEDIVAAMKHALEGGDTIAAIELDTRFHTLLIDGAGNNYLSRTWSVVGLPFLIWAPERELYPLAEEESSIAFNERHAELVTVFRQRDPEACAASIRSHILRKLVDVGATTAEPETGTRHREEA